MNTPEIQASSPNNFLAYLHGNRREGNLSIILFLSFVFDPFLCNGAILAILQSRGSVPEEKTY